MVLIVVMSVLVGLGRFCVPGHNLSWAGTYEAFAHIWVGALLVFAFEHNPTVNRKWPAIISLLIVTALEGVMFFLFKQE